MRARSSFVFALVPLLGLVTGCVERAAVPPVRQAVDAPSRQRVYEDYRLTYDRGIFGESWVRRDGSYNLPELENVIEAYPETRDVKHRIEGRRLAIGTVGGVGAGIVGFTLGFNLFGHEQDRMSSSTQVALYVTGGSLMLASIVMEIAWRDPAADLADVYNRSLANDLGLAPGAPGNPAGPPPVYRASSLKPRFVIAPTPVVTPSGAIAPGLG